ncbi:hypothetical protein [Prevotella sp. 10(H)]|uniref:LIC_10190 family membrane protein n=1 Tax=Prevotella sp. 10(H) TaxID=1158294 RepID=UPI0004A7086C|nr:hypothetical protein [Prevotella sp. 10(H)]
MFAIFLCWFLIAVTFISLGDFFIFIYNKLCKKKERYSVTDTLFLGMIFILIPLSISSFWLPSNHYILLAYFIFSVLYWAIRYKYFIFCLKQVKRKIKSLSVYQLIVILLAILSVGLLSVYLGGQWLSHDSFYYHQAAIRWNEEYAIVPGLGNVEERFGFNSNYLLISAIYTLRFIFDEPIYGFQSFMCVAVLAWIVTETFRSGFEVKRVIILLLYTGFILMDRNVLGVTSTDIIPNLTIIYLAMKTVLYPHQVKKKLLFYVAIPIGLATFKLSIIFIALSGVLIFFWLIKQKDYRTVSFLFSTAFAIIGLWFIRNVIISGYLVHPLYQIDLFSFDWKVPAHILIRETHDIAAHARYEYMAKIWEDFLAFRVWKEFSWHIPLYALSLASMIFITAKIIKKKKEINKIYLYMAAILGINIIYWLATAPSIRFGYGYVFSLIFLAITLMFYRNRYDNYKLNILIISLESKNGKRYGTADFCKYISIILFGFIFIQSYKSISDYRHFLREYCGYSKSQSSRKPFYAPYSTTEQIMETSKIMEIPGPPFEPYEINNGITIYIATEERGFIYDVVPATSNEARGAQSFKKLEARGKSIQDGFRSKENYK